MTPDDLDRILSSEEPLVPSSGFAAAVMESVRAATTAPPPLPFPWRRFLLGLLAVSVLGGACGWAAASLGVPETLGAAFGDPRLSRALAEAGASLAGTYLLGRLALRFTGGRA